MQYVPMEHRTQGLGKYLKLKIPVCFCFPAASGTSAVSYAIEV